jgi:pyruvate dehydrogenase E1 component alpha subunit
MATAAKRASARRADAKSGGVPVTPRPAEFSKEQELEAYRGMLLIRRFEEKAGQLYGMGFIGGFCHLYIGQEAVVTGMKMSADRRRSDDHCISRPRPHAGDGPVGPRRHG